MPTDGEDVWPLLQRDRIARLSSAVVHTCKRTKASPSRDIEAAVAAQCGLLRLTVIALGTEARSASL